MGRPNNTIYILIIERRRVTLLHKEDQKAAEGSSK